MLLIIGYIIVIFSVFGGYAISGGHLKALFQPLEFLIIGGASLGSFIVSNDVKVLKATGKDIIRMFKPPKSRKKFCIELLSLFFELSNKIKKEGMLAIEQDIENVKESPLFSKYKIVQSESKIMEFLCDHLRLMLTGRVDLMQLESIMDSDVETFETEHLLSPTAIQKMSDGMPAFGIVAAVLGVVHTMESIGAPPEVLGRSIAAALVGTFLGILVGYGFIGPIATAIEGKVHSDLKILESIKVVLAAISANLAPSITVEFARKILYSAERPSNKEMEDVLTAIKSSAQSGG